MNEKESESRSQESVWNIDSVFCNNSCANSEYRFLNYFSKSKKALLVMQFPNCLIPELLARSFEAEFDCLEPSIY